LIRDTKTGPQALVSPMQDWQVFFILISIFFF